MATFADIEKKLRASFQAMKKDIMANRASIERALKDIDSVKNDGKEIKDKAITKDKLNVLKLQLGELKDEVKKSWALEEEFKELEERTVPKDFFNQQF